MKRYARQALTEWQVFAAREGSEAAFKDLRALGRATSADWRWCALSFVLVLTVTFMKLWFWLEMHTNHVLRELKRVELLLVTRPPQP